MSSRLVPLPPQLQGVFEYTRRQRDNVLQALHYTEDAWITTVKPLSAEITKLMQERNQQQQKLDKALQDIAKLRSKSNNVDLYEAAKVWKERYFSSQLALGRAQQGHTSMLEAHRKAAAENEQMRRHIGQLEAKVRAQSVKAHSPDPQHNSNRSVNDEVAARNPGRMSQFHSNISLQQLTSSFPSLYRKRRASPREY